MEKNFIKSDNCHPVSLNAQNGCILHTQKGEEIKLGPVLGEGCEGTVFMTYSHYVAKIYKPRKLSSRKLTKLQALLDKKLYCPGVCLPKALLYNLKNEFVGYLMDRAEGEKIRYFYQIDSLREKFPHWNRTDLVKLCIAILKKIDYLHGKGIVLGDINLDNILVKTPEDVYLVDCDSYQVGEYPCPVGTIQYTPPELQNKGPYDTYLRSVGNENFAVAVLLFSLMVTGQMPYGWEDDERARQKIVNMEFAYPIGQVWNRLPEFLREAFLNTFQKDGCFSAESTRLGASDWLEKFYMYLGMLDTGKYDGQDEIIDWFCVVYMQTESQSMPGGCVSQAKIARESYFTSND